VEGDRLIFTGDSVPGENIRPQGEDFKAGDILVRRGEALSPGTLGVMAAFGKSEVMVFRRPRVAVLGLGKGIVPYQAKPLPGQVRDSNGPLLAALAMRNGAQVADVDLVGDGDLARIRNVLEKLLRQADIVLTTGEPLPGSAIRPLAQ
jgi:molybdopterin molybdotransferase